MLFIWFWLVAIMITAYVVLDGFDLGAGILHLLIAKTDQERQHRDSHHWPRMGRQ